MKIKLKAKPLVLREERVKFEGATPMQHRWFNQSFTHNYENGQEAINDAMTLMMENFTPTAKKEKGNSTSEIIEEILECRLDAIAELDMETVAIANRHIEKQKHDT